MEKNYFLPAEWHPQSYIQLTWPHSGTDWNYMLDEVETCFFNLASEIASRQPLLLIAPEYPEKLKDFKYKDNLINWNLYQSNLLKGSYTNCRNFILEGGSIESDGKGTMLTTSTCLLAPNRNDVMTREDIELYLKERFNLQQVLWLDHGFLAGDDTDSHIDTLARLCPDNTIVYVQCTDSADEHYDELSKMEEQLKTFRTLENTPYRLLPLPMPTAIYDEEGERLPATYANFLIMNDAILYPTYNQPDNDQKAAQILVQAFPEKDIVGIDCCPLIKQHGSLHCVTMQYPESVKNSKH